MFSIFKNIFSIFVIFLVYYGSSLKSYDNTFMYFFNISQGCHAFWFNGFLFVYCACRQSTGRKIPTHSFGKLK